MDLARLVAGALELLGKFADGGLAVGEDDRGADVLGTQQLAERVGACRAMTSRPGAARSGGWGGPERGRPRSAWGWTRNRIAIFLIGAPHGRGNSSVCRSCGQLGADFLDVGMNPMSSIRSASSITSSEQPEQQDLAAAEQVHQPARRGDQHVDALCQAAV
jgi:hypothetical protein